MHVFVKDKVCENWSEKSKCVAYERYPKIWWHYKWESDKVVKDRFLLNNPGKKIHEKVIIILILYTITTLKYLTETWMNFNEKLTNLQ